MQFRLPTRIDKRGVRFGENSMKKRIVIPVLCLISLSLFLLSGSLAFASWYVRSDTLNKLTTSAVAGQVMEEYEQDRTVYPGAWVNKRVQVKNTGNADVMVRVHIDKVWGSRRDKNGRVVPDPSLNTDNIKISFHTEKWLLRDDGYYYYMAVLAPGETTPCLFDGFTVDGKMTTGKYKNKNADIIVRMEMVQAEYHGLSYWGTSFAELGISYKGTEHIPIMTTVEFNNPTDGFTFTANGGDLFSEFKDLVRGDCRSQFISVANNWDRKTEIFLSAEYTEQSFATEDSYKSIIDLLHKYATINITDQYGTLIYSGPVYGNTDIDSKGTDSMKYPISLGSFLPGEVKYLNVSLYIDTNMGDSCDDLLALVKWVFTAQNISTDSYDPYGNSSGGDIYTFLTGEQSRPILYAAITLISGIAFVILIRKNRKSKI